MKKDLIKALSKASAFLEGDGFISEASVLDAMIRKIANPERKFAIELRMKAYVPQKVLEGMEEPPITSHKKVDYELVVSPVVGDVAQEASPATEPIKGSFQGNSAQLVEKLDGKINELKAQFTPSSFATKLEFVGV